MVAVPSKQMAYDVTSSPVEFFMKKLSVIALSATILFGNTAFAQGQRGVRGAAVPPPSQEMIFGDELVAGSLVRPDETTVRGNRRGPGISLLRLRHHFVQEMLKSVENL